MTLRESLTRTPLKLKEAVNPEETEGWWVPVSYYGKKNGNGRIYGKKRNFKCFRKNHPRKGQVFNKA